MSQKKNNYWDQIFMTPAQEEDASINEENALDFSKATPNQENDKHFREIFFSEENETLLKTEETPLSTASGLARNETTVCSTVNSAVSQSTVADLNVEPLDVSLCSSASEDASEELDDFFCGWTQTTKTYAHFGLEGKEIDLTKSTEPEESVNTEEDAEMNDDAEETSVALEFETAESSPIHDAEQEVTPVLSEDGSLRRVLNRYERPSMGFGFGLLDEEDAAKDESEIADAVDDAADEDSEVDAEAADEENSPVNETETETARPEGLDSWGSLAFDLGLPITLPEATEKEELKAVEETEKAKKQEKRGKRNSFSPPDVMENAKTPISIDLDDEDFVSPENIFAENERKPEVAIDEKSEKDERPERSRRSRRSRRGKKENEAVSETIEEIQAPETPEAEIPAKEPVSRRRSRRKNIQETVVNDEKSAAIGGIVAGVVASKITETEKSKSKFGRRREAEEKLVAQNDFCDVEEEDSFANELDEEEMNLRNGARSRRRRRNQREKQERNRKIQEAPVCSIDDDEEELRDDASVFSAKRVRRNERRGANSFEMSRDDYAWQEPMKMELEIETDEEDEEELPRPRRQRRSRRSASLEVASRFEEHDFDDDSYPPQDDEEAHVFTEVQDDEEEEDYGEWETDFSQQHDIPGWRYTIDFIVNTNLKARKREPSTMAGSINRIAKRGGKRK